MDAFFPRQTAPNFEEISAAVEELNTAVDGNDHRIIRQSIERLDRSTRRLAELMMDSAVSGAIGGKTMQAAGESMGAGPTAPHPFAPAQIEESASSETNVIVEAEYDPETPARSTED